MLNLTREDGGVPANVDLYREREIENNVINIITMSLQMNVQLTVTQLLFAMPFFRFFFGNKLVYGELFAQSKCKFS